MLPNEVLLDTLHFVDYRTLVLAKLAGARLQHLVTNSAAGLACRRKFSVTVFFHWISCKDPSTKKSCHAGYYEGKQQSLVAACREVAETIGPHAVAVLEFPKGSWSVADVGVIFEAAPPLKYAEEVRVRTIADDGTGIRDLRAHSAAFMRNFSGLKTLRLWLDDDLFRQFDCTFLGQDAARNLRLISVSDTTSTCYEQANDLVERLVRYCLTLPRTLGGEPLELDFSGKPSRAALVRRMIELLKDSRRELTFRMRLWGDELVLAEDDYAVNVVDNRMRYVSASSGIVVEVKGHRITIQSTAKLITE